MAKSTNFSKTTAKKNVAKGGSKADSKTGNNSGVGKGNKTNGTKRNAAPAKQSSAKKPAAKARSVRSRTSKDGTLKIKTLSNEIKGILFIALGIFLACAFLTQSTGAVGTFLKDVFYGLLGSASAISCIFIILTGFNVFVNKGNTGNAFRFSLLAGLILTTSVLAALIFKDTTFSETGFTNNLIRLAQDGMDGIGGGVLGSGLCKIFVNMIGIAGAWVLTIAAELILVILLTGISLESIFRKIAAGLQNQRQQARKYADSEIEIDIPEYDEGESQRHPIQRKRALPIGRKKSSAPAEDEVPASAEKNKKGKGGFMDEYFTGQDPLSGESVPPEEPEGLKETSTENIPQRFTFQEDDELLKNIFPQHAESTDEENLPFRLDNMKTGVLTELPFQEENGQEQEKPDEETGDFSPPSEAKLEDVMDPLTKKALDAGLPLDRAVVAGRQMALGSDDEPPFAAAAAQKDSERVDEVNIGDQIEESKTVLPRIIQYRMPTIDLLAKPKTQAKTREEVKYELEEKANRLLDTLRSFKVEAKIINITQGPSVTRFELQPGFGVKVSKITGLADDIALSLAAPGVRIEAPIPGKSAIGIEIPNRHPVAVPIREVLDSEKFKEYHSKTAFALGKDIAGNCVVADIADFPHVLIAGATGSGKSVCINSLITSILYKAKPDEIKMIMVDPKMVELGVYNGIPHLLIPVVTDPKHAAGALNWAVGEMKNRYNLLRDNKVRNLKGYNALMEELGEPDSKLPEIVIIIDELADLMMAAKNEVEDAINSLAALARAAGMYLVIATQRPSVNVITGVIKANVPSRISFAVTSQIDSRTIIDSPGAEKLLGKGDMLYCPRGSMKPLRVQGNFVSDGEIERITQFIKDQYEASYDEEIIEDIQREHERVAADLEGDSGSSTGDGTGTNRDSGHRDELFLQAAELVLENGQASVAMFQRRFKIGYQRAARLIDQMEERRIIGPYEGTKPRQVLITRQELNEMKMNASEN